MSTDDAVRDQAERIVLGAMMTSPAAVETVTDAGLTSGDFWHPHHGVLFAYITAAYADGEPTEPVAMTKRLADAGALKPPLGAPYLVECQQAVPVVAEVGYYAGIVADAAYERRVAEVLARGTNLVASGGARQAAQLTAAGLAELSNLTAASAPPPELGEFLDQPDPEYEWTVPGLLERGDRLILTGPEGRGKSTLLRQVAVQAACGLHPFGGNDFDPLRVLHIELENGPRHTRREYRRLRAAAGKRYSGKPGLAVAVAPAGLDLLADDQGRWLLDQTRTVRPDLLIVGPLYKLASGDPTDEQVARTVALWLDRVRAAAGCALLIEAHTPHAGNGRHRPERPYGASLWLRWPEFGLYLSADGALRHWRGQRDEREWPTALQRGGEWPWTPATRGRDVLWARIQEEAGKMDGQLSMRDAARLTGSTLPTVQRTIAEHRDEWDALTSSLLSRGDTP